MHYLVTSPFAKVLACQRIFSYLPKTIRLALQAHGWKYQPTTRTWLLIDQAEQSVPASNSVARVVRGRRLHMAPQLRVDPLVV